MQRGVENLLAMRIVLFTMFIMIICRYIKIVSHC